MVQEVNRQFVERVKGFHVVGVAGNGGEGVRLVRELTPDLVFLDIFMPTLDGIETLRKLRAEEIPVDVVVVTAAKDSDTVQAMMRNGAMDYIIKPFKFERIQETLERFRTHRVAFTNEQVVTQAGLDRLLNMKSLLPGESSGSVSENRMVEQESLPKGLNAVTMKQVLNFMQKENRMLSAEEVADGVGIARVTARRYLDYLEKSWFVSLDIRYGSVGRPINRYVLIHEHKDQK
jgi:two-component system response regulator DctR